MNMMERYPRPSQENGFSKEEEDFLNSPASPDVIPPAEDPFAEPADEEPNPYLVAAENEPATAQEKGFELSDASRGEFSKDEEKFFGREDATAAEEPSFEKMAAELNESIDQKKAEDAAALEGAREALVNAAEDISDAPTDKSTVVELFPTKTESAFGEMEDKFFAEGEKKYGSDNKAAA